MIGYSGCPVFVQDKQTKNIVFIGILCGTNVPANGLFVVRPEFLYQQIH
jgi:hypothetical protein